MGVFFSHETVSLAFSRRVSSLMNLRAGVASAMASFAGVLKSAAFAIDSLPLRNSPSSSSTSRKNSRRSLGACPYSRAGRRRS